MTSQCQDFPHIINQMYTQIEHKKSQSEFENINLESERLNELISWDEFKGDFT
jgi:hypothetical protein